MKKSVFGIRSIEGGRTVGPSQTEINAHRGNIHDLQAALTHKQSLFGSHMPELMLPIPEDKEQTIQCQSGLEFKIEAEHHEQDRLTDKKHRVDDKASKTHAEHLLQESMHASAADIVAKHMPSKVKAVDSLHFRIVTIPQSDILQSNIYGDICKLGDTAKFDLLLSRTPDINSDGHKGLFPIDHATIHQFAYGIETLIENGANPNSALIYALHQDNIAAVHSLVRMTSNLIGYNQIFTRLQTDNLITQLDLSDCRLTCDAIEQLSLSLTSNKSLKELNLAKNYFGYKGATSLATILEKNQSISLLDISYSNIDQDIISCIVAALSKHKSIKVLNVSNNKLEAEGGIALSALLEHSKSIIDLDASSNNLTDIGAAYIIDRAFKSDSLLKLSIQDNTITDALAEDIEEGIEATQRIVFFNIEDNEFSSAAWEAIEAAIERSTTNNILSTFSEDSVLGEPYSSELLAENIPEYAFN